MIRGDDGSVIINYVAYSKTFLSEKKLHLIYFATWNEMEQSFGAKVKSECGLEGILLRPEPFLSIDKSCERFEKAGEVVGFFTPIQYLDFKLGLTVPSEGQRICEICKDNFAVSSGIGDALLKEVTDYKKTVERESKK